MVPKVLYMCLHITHANAIDVIADQSMYIIPACCILILFGISKCVHCISFQYAVYCSYLAYQSVYIIPACNVLFLFGRSKCVSFKHPVYCSYLAYQSVYVHHSTMQYIVSRAI